MNRRMTFVLGAAALAAMLVVGRMHAQTAAPAQAKPAAPAPGAGPVIVVDTSKGTFEFETYPKEAPKTVEHIVALVKRNFYNGQVFHRVVADFVVQWGDPQTRDATLKGKWGTGGSGKPIGAAEMSPLHTHKYGAVAMAHSGSPALADSQMYIVIRQSGTAQLDGGYTVFGQVVSGMDVVMKIAQGDMVKRMSVKGETAPAK